MSKIPRNFELGFILASVVMGASGSIFARASGTISQTTVKSQEILLSHSLPFGGIETVERPDDDAFDMEVPVSGGVDCNGGKTSCESYSQVGDSPNLQLEDF